MSITQVKIINSLLGPKPNKINYRDIILESNPDMKPLRSIKDEITSIYTRNFFNKNHYLLIQFIKFVYTIMNFYIEKYTNKIIIKERIDGIQEQIIFNLKGGNNMVLFKILIKDKMFRSYDNNNNLLKKIRHNIFTEDYDKHSDNDFNILIITSNIIRFNIIKTYVIKALIISFKKISKIFDYLYNDANNNRDTNVEDKKTKIREIINNSDLYNNIHEILNDNAGTCNNILNYYTYKKIQNYCDDINIYNDEIKGNDFYNYTDIHNIQKITIEPNNMFEITKLRNIYITNSNNLIFNTSNSQNSKKGHIKLDNPVIYDLKNTQPAIHFFSINNTPSSYSHGYGIVSFDLLRMKFATSMTNISINNLKKEYKQSISNNNENPKPIILNYVEYKNFNIKTNNNTNNNTEIFSINDKNIITSYTNTPAEFIDVSILSFEDEAYRKILLSINNDNQKIILQKTFLNYNNFKIISLEYIIKDLQHVLFGQSTLIPYYDIKYNKRIDRLLFFYIFYIFTKLEKKEQLNYLTFNKTTNYDTVKTKLKNLFEFFKNPITMKSLLDDQNTFFDNYNNKIYNISNNFLYKLQPEYEIINIFINVYFKSYIKILNIPTLPRRLDNAKNNINLDSYNLNTLENIHNPDFKYFNNINIKYNKDNNKMKEYVNDYKKIDKYYGIVRNNYQITYIVGKNIEFFNNVFKNFVKYYIFYDLHFTKIQSVIHTLKQPNLIEPLRSNATSLATRRPSLATRRPSSATLRPSSATRRPSSATRRPSSATRRPSLVLPVASAQPVVSARPGLRERLSSIKLRR